MNSEPAMQDMLCVHALLQSVEPKYVLSFETCFVYNYYIAIPQPFHCRAGATVAAPSAQPAQSAQPAAPPPAAAAPPPPLAAVAPPPVATAPPAAWPLPKPRHR